MISGSPYSHVLPRAPKQCWRHGTFLKNWYQKECNSLQVPVYLLPLVVRFLTDTNNQVTMVKKMHIQPKYYLK